MGGEFTLRQFSLAWLLRREFRGSGLVKFDIDVLSRDLVVQLRNVGHFEVVWGLCLIENLVRENDIESFSLGLFESLIYYLEVQNCKLHC